MHQSRSVVAGAVAGAARAGARLRSHRRLAAATAVGLAALVTTTVGVTVTAGDVAPPAAEGTVVPSARDRAAALPPAETAPTDPAALLPVPARGTGQLLVAVGSSAVTGTGPLRTYRVEVEDGLSVLAADFAAAVEAVLGDPRGWSAVDGISLQRVDGPAADVVVLLASPGLTDELCAPLETAGRYSCFDGTRSVVNAERWRNGAASYGADLDGYRQYVVNHEVGHALGHGHRSCPGAGRPAPVMVQQSIGLDGCTPNPWPAVA